MLEDVEGGANRRQGVAQLVREDGDELALAAIGLAQLVDQVPLGGDVLAHHQQLVHLTVRAEQRNDGPLPDEGGPSRQLVGELVGLPFAGLDGAFAVLAKGGEDRFGEQLVPELPDQLFCRDLQLHRALQRRARD